jgi:hypothetical protein
MTFSRKKISPCHLVNGGCRLQFLKTVSCLSTVWAVWKVFEKLFEKMGSFRVPNGEPARFRGVLASIRGCWLFLCLTKLGY